MADKKLKRVNLKLTKFDEVFMSLVISEKDNGMGIITFNNPPKGFLTSEMIAETIPMIEDLDNDDSIKIVIFTGGMPGVFIKHFQLKKF